MYFGKKILTILLAAGLACSVIGCGSKSSSGESSAESSSTAARSVDSSDSSAAGSSSADSGEALPYELEDGKLEVTSVFTSDIENPDCGNEYADSIASIEVANKSDTALISGDFQMKMANEDLTISFHIDYLPAGETAWLFSTDNTTLEDTAFSEITSECAFADGDVMMKDSVEVSVEDTVVSLTNTSDDTLSGLTVYCHCTMGDALYGGAVYTYPVDSIAPGETATVEAEDCILGTAEVVSVQQNN